MRRYRFQPGRSSTEEIRRVALAQLECAVAEIADDDLDDVKRIHLLRKRFKKLRSLFRLVAATDRKFARRENDRFRGLGQMLSSRRDADVVLATIDSLSGGSKESAPGFPVVRKRLSAARGPAGKPDALQRVEQGLHEAREAILSWSPPKSSWSVLFDEFVARYRRGRKAFRAAQRDVSPETMHEWRKRTKDCWYQMRLLRDFWNGSSGRPIKRLRKLSMLLGDDHDLAVLSDRCRRKPKSKREAAEITAIQRRIARKRKRLRKQCLKLGRKVFGLKPKSVRRKLKCVTAPTADSDDAADFSGRFDAVTSGQHFI